MRVTTTLLLLLLCIGLTTAAQAQTTASHPVTIDVASVELITLNDASVSISVPAPAAGSATSVATAASTYNVTSNLSNRKITGELDAAYPSGITLAVAMNAPTASSQSGASAGSSAGSQVLGVAPVNLVTGMSYVYGSGIGMTYTATVDAGIAVQSPSRDVTYTLTSN